MNINSLNKRIDVYAKSECENEVGDIEYKYNKQKTIWAAIIPQTGRLQVQQANTILSDVTHKVIVRYEAGKEITQDMYFMFRDKKLDIKYILNPYFKNESLEIFCQELTE